MQQEEIFGSAYASAVYISKVLKMPKEKKVYVIGQAGLEEELDNLGIARSGGSVCSFVLSHGHTNIQDPEDNVFIESMDWSTIKPDQDVVAVLCGFDAYVSKYRPSPC